MTANTFKPEQQATADAKALSENKSGEGHAHALSEIQTHAAKAGISGAKDEQAYWSSFKKEAAADHLPNLEFGAEPEGRQTSVKMGGDQLYNRDKAVVDVKDSGTGNLGKAEGPYQAFVKSGMSNDEAQAAAKHVEDATGRKSFNQGEKFAIHPDGSVSTKTEHNGNSSETTYGAKGGKQKTVETNKDGSTKETDFDKDKPTKTIETKPASGDHPASRTETTLGPDGNPLTSTEIQGDAKGAHKEISKDFTAHYTTTKDVAADGSSVSTTDHGDGTSSVENRNKEGKVTHTRDTSKTGYVDKTLDPTTGKPTLTVDHTNGQNGAYKETRSYKDDSGYNRSDIYSVGAHAPGQQFNTDQSFSVNGVEQLHKNITYDGQGKNGHGTQTKIIKHEKPENRPLVDQTWPFEH